MFKFAEGVNFKSVPVIVSGLFIWAVGNTMMVRTGYAAMPGFSLALGFIGAAAVVTMGVLLSKTRLAAPLRYAGENSIVIYLAFFLFMAARAACCSKPVLGSIWAAWRCSTTAAGVAGPILLFWATRQTKLSLLFRRPAVGKAGIARPARWHSAAMSARNHPEARRPSLSHRRFWLYFPRLSRAAAAHAQVRRPARGRRAGLLQHAVEAAEGNRTRARSPPISR